MPIFIQLSFYFSATSYITSLTFIVIDYHIYYTTRFFMILRDLGNESNFLSVFWQKMLFLISNINVLKKKSCNTYIFLCSMRQQKCYHPAIYILYFTKLLDNMPFRIHGETIILGTDINAPNFIMWFITIKTAGVRYDNKNQHINQNDTFQTEHKCPVPIRISQKNGTAYLYIISKYSVMHVIFFLTFIFLVIKPIFSIMSIK